jgi:hypothetical protein
MHNNQIRILAGLVGPALLLLGSLPALAQTSDMGYLTAKVSPGRAGVFLDGKYLGPAANFRVARTYTVPAGEHEVRLTDPRYEEVVTKVTIQAGKKTTLRQTLKPLPLAKPPFGVLRTIHPDGMAAVYVNGKFYGHVDEFSNATQGLLLNPGEYSVKIVPVSGGAPIEQKVTIEANKTTVVK